MNNFICESYSNKVMSLIKYVTVIFFLVSFYSCKDNSHKHWTYSGETGPEHWEEIEHAPNCSGLIQSPINIIDYECQVNKELALRVHYNTQTIIKNVVNNTHSIQFNFNKGDSIVLNDTTYHLKQVHFHEPSEHTIDGVRYLLEIHLVHESNYGRHTVLSVMSIEGKDNTPFNFLESYLPINKNEIKNVEHSFNLNAILPKDKQSFYYYIGSLTTPPCTENINWIIFKTPIIISYTQVKKLEKNMPKNNYRNQQPINDRIIYKNF